MRHARAGVLALGAVLICSLAACEKSGHVVSTADRVKLVEERQKSDPNFHAPIKAPADARSTAGSVTGTAYAAVPQAPGGGPAKAR